MELIQSLTQNLVGQIVLYFVLGALVTSIVSMFNLGEALTNSLKSLIPYFKY